MMLQSSELHSPYVSTSPVYMSAPTALRPSSDPGTMKVLPCTAALPSLFTAFSMGTSQHNHAMQEALNSAVGVVICSG